MPHNMQPPHAPIMVFARAVGPDFGGFGRATHEIDVSVHVGTEIELLRSAVVKILGCSFPIARYLVDAGVIKTRGRYCIIDPGTNLVRLYEEWIASLPMPTRHREFSRIRKVRQKCGVNRRHPYPQHILQGVVMKLLQIGSFYSAEILGLISVHPEDLANMREILRAMAGVLGITRTPLPAGVVPSNEMFTAAFPTLADLPHSCLAPNSEEWREPSARVRRIAWAAGPAAGMLALYVFLAPGLQRRDTEVEVIASRLAAFDKVHARLHPGAGIEDGTKIRATLDAIMKDSSLRPSRRENICRTWIDTTSSLRWSARRIDPNGTHGLASLVPPEPQGLPDLLDALASEFKDLRPEGRLRRKERSDFLSDNLVHIEGAMALRMEQIIVTGRELRTAVEKFETEDALRVANGGWARKHIDVFVYTTVLDHRGCLTGRGVQKNIWRVWREEAYLRVLARRGTSGSIKGLRDRIAGFERDRQQDITSPERFVYEFIGCEPVLGGITREPWFVTIDRLGLTASPSLMTAKMAHKRHQLLIQWKLPALQGSATGLLNATEHQALIWTAAAEHGRCVVHVDNLEHAFRFAHAAVAGVLESFGRLHEVMQQVQDTSGWTTRPMPDKTELGGWLAMPKLAKGQPVPEKPLFFPASNIYIAELQELSAMTVRREGHADGLLPKLPPPPGLDYKSVEPDAFIYQSGGRHLQSAEIHRFIDFLLAGWGRFDCHDFRHAVANWARGAGVPGKIIRAALNHEDDTLWKWYSRLTQRQKAELERLGEDDRMRNAADCRSMQRLAA